MKYGVGVGVGELDIPTPPPATPQRCETELASWLSSSPMSRRHLPDGRPFLSFFLFFFFFGSVASTLHLVRPISVTKRHQRGGSRRMTQGQQKTSCFLLPLLFKTRPRFLSLSCPFPPTPPVTSSTVCSVSFGTQGFQ